MLSSDDLRFGESLTQEVAYEGLLLKQRRLLHERIGELLEHDLERNPEHAALLAHHYSRSDNHTKAIDALLRAAREAEEAPSYRVAADLYRRAWRLAETVLGEREDGRFHRAALTAVSGITRLTVFFGAIDLSEAEEAAVRGRELAALLGDQGALAQLHYAHGIITIMRPNAPDFAGGLALAERGLTIAEEAGLDGERSRIARGLAMNYAVDGRFDQARSLIEVELAGLESGPDGARRSDLYLSTRWIRDLVHYASDDLDWIVTKGSETFAMCAERGNRTIRTAIGTLLAPAHFLRAEYDEARRWADMTLETAEAIANVNAFTTSSSLALLTRALLGEQVDAAPYVDRIEQGLRAGGLMQLNTRFVAEALLAIGDLERADQLTEKLVRIPGGRLRQSLVLSARGDVLARLGRRDRAVERYAEALAIAETIGSRSTLAAALLGRAEVAASRGEVPRDLERLGGIVDGLRLLHYRPRLERLLAQTGMGEPSRG